MNIFIICALHESVQNSADNIQVKGLSIVETNQHKWFNTIALWSQEILVSDQMNTQPGVFHLNVTLQAMLTLLSASSVGDLVNQDSHRASISAAFC